MDYSKTVNLLKTDFSMKANLREKEPQILSFWKEEDIYHKLIAKGEKDYILHDGPPYANGELHIGHAQNKILKDITVRYKALSGYKTPFIPGWDCHGMPIEHKVTENMKELPPRMDVRRLCRDYAENYVNIQREQFIRLGILGDWENPYLTYDKKYEADVLRVFKSLLDDGYIYRERRPIHWCIRCRTALAEAELEYKGHTSPSIYVKFPIESSDDELLRSASFLVWTTTPWTLPANVALALGKEIDYSLVDTEKGRFILATTRLSVLEEIRLPYKKLANIYGNRLKGILAHHPFFDRESRVILADFVSTEEGTGVVHIAPGHGYEDYLVGKEYGLPILSPVDDEGKFTEEVGEVAGKVVFSANDEIIALLKKNGNLIGSDLVTHSYPHCWRCGNPLVFRTTPQWFVKVDHNKLRARCLSVIDKIEWIPGWSRERMRDTLASRPDWCISRQRNWGVPIPALQCEECGNVFLDSEIVKRAIQLVEKEGSDAWLEGKGDIESGRSCPECGGKKLRRESDILDVWFESSSSFSAVVKKRLHLPADLYLEGVDQHRGWFQLSLILSMATREELSFTSCLTHGLVLDIQKKKMSKKLGNVMSPQVIVKQFGADILRLYFASVDYTRDMEFGEESIEATTLAYRKIRNTFRYILGNLFDFDKSQSITYEKLPSIDRYVLSTLQQLIERVKKAYDEFDFHRVYSLLFNYCNITLSRFYFDILKDRLYTYRASSLERRSAQTVLYELMRTLSVIFAPIIPFTTEEVWQKAGLSGSVHLQDFPIGDKSLIDEALISEWEKLTAIREKVLLPLEVARRDELIGNSLEAKVRIFARDADEIKLLRNMEDILPSVFIVSQVEVVSKESDISGMEIGELLIEVKRAEGDKCARCWIHSDTVGENPIHPTLCRKCIEVITSN
ncbi:MAG: isoleucine--tRNA ligase [candidate division WOR-3 bacterium]|nr:isoleucine--tRNA ligase [candidate division WOR-3 bacterium]